MVAVDVILGKQKGERRPDVVVAIVDASNLDRNLYLTTQAMELGVPVVVALNMIDVAEKQGIRIDHEQLAKHLGVPVVPIQANKGKGLDRLREAVARVAGEPGASATGGVLPTAPGPRFPDAFENEVAILQGLVGPGVPEYLVRRLLLDVGGYTEQRLVQRLGPEVSRQVKEARERLVVVHCTVPSVEAKIRYAWIRQVTHQCVQRPTRRPVAWTDRLDRVLTHRLWGTLLFLLVMFVVFQSIFTWARPLMKLIDQGKDLAIEGVKAILPAGPLTSLLTDGVITGVGGVLVFLPQILILFGFIAILEDCGYMARAAFLMDKLMSRCGLSGKSFIPMLSSMACAVPGIMATRVIENRRDRLTTILVAPLMSCSARLPVYTLLIGAFLTQGHSWWVPGLVMFLMYAIGLIVAPLVALALKRSLLRGETPVFVMEMPLYKRPALRTVLGRMVDACWAFLRRAGTIILATMILVWALLYFPSGDGQGGSYPERIAKLDESIAAETDQIEKLNKSIKKQKKAIRNLDRQVARMSEEQARPLIEQADKLKEEIKPTSKEIETLEKVTEPVEEEIHLLEHQWKRQTILGRLGQAIEPAVRPLGWDWRIGVAALASFPAREVVVGTLGIIYQVGKVDSDELGEFEDVSEHDLSKKLRAATWEGTDRKVFTIPVAVSLMVFFALCCQCASTLAVIRRETGGWGWPLFSFTYMTVLAYLGALVVFQVGSLLI